MKVRAWQLAKELDISSKDLIKIAEDKNIKITNHLSALTQNQVDVLREAYESPKKKSKKDEGEKKKQAPSKKTQPSSKGRDRGPSKDVRESREKSKKTHTKDTGKSFAKDKKKGKKEDSAELSSSQRDLERAERKASRSKTHKKREGEHHEKRQRGGSGSSSSSRATSSREGRSDNKRNRGQSQTQTQGQTQVQERRGKGKGRRHRHQRGGRSDMRHGGHKHRRVEKKKPVTADRERPIEVIVPVSVKDLSQAIGVSTSQIIKKLLEVYGETVTINQVLHDKDYVQTIGLEFNKKKMVVKEGEDPEEKLMKELEEQKDSPEDMAFRAPVVTFMGHVDHGKTSLLDYIRKTNVASKEAGGITQHIGAYKVKAGGHKHSIVFLDTPGHEAFTSMRARGANVTDIVVLVVAADDGVMPQTIEAINHAKAANVPIIVAINKVDKPGAKIDLTEQQLSRHGLMPEKWQGDTIFVNVSAITGDGVDELLEYIGLVAEIQELKANSQNLAQGVVLEAKVKEGKGAVATLLVQDGTLKKGDFILCGNGYGRVRDMINDLGQVLKKAGPSTPVEISGLSDLPNAGDKFYAVKNQSQAKSIAAERQQQAREKELSQSSRKISVEQLMKQFKEGTSKEFCIILKGDVQGSVEAISAKLQQISHKEIEIKLLHAATGGINERDVQLALASEALIIGFNVVATKPARDLAEDKGIEIKCYNVIYHLLEDIKNIMSGMLPPEKQEKVTGHVVIRKVIKISKLGNIAGCYVTDGYIERNSKVRVSRQGVLLNKAKAFELASLKRFKEDVPQVKEGFECGIRIADFDDFKEGDEIEAFQIVEVARSLD